MSPPHRVGAVLLATALLATGGVVAPADGPLTAQFEQTALVVDDEPVETALVVGNATGNVTVTAGNVSTETLVRMFDGTRTEEGVVVTVPSDGRVPVTVPPALGCHPQEYEFRVTDGRATATAAVEIATTPALRAAFTDGVVTARPGMAAEIGVHLDRCLDGPATLVVGDGDSPLRASVSVVPNGTGDVDGAVLVDGEDLEGPAAFGATGALSIRSVTISERPPNGTLPAGEYRLKLRTDGEAADLATLSVATVSPTPTSATTGTPTATATTPPSRSSTATEPASSPGAPGFTVAAAVGAVLLVALSIRQRA